MLQHQASTVFAKRIVAAEADFEDVFGAHSTSDVSFVEKVRAALTANSSSEVCVDVHWRLLAGTSGELAVVCVQDFDYADYESWRFVGAHRFVTEAEAEAARIFLRRYIGSVI
jgi:predicted amidohydrolase